MEEHIKTDYEENQKNLAQPCQRSEQRRSWTDSLDDKWNAYTVLNIETKEMLATFYREDLAFEFVKMLNEKLSIPAWWSPDIGEGLRGDKQ